MTIRLTALRKITDLKNRLTQQATWEYTEAMRDLVVEQHKLHELESVHDSAIQELHNRTYEPVPVQELHAWMLYAKLQRMQIEEQNNVVATQEQECQNKRKALTEQYQDEQKWIRLQERRQLEHRAHLEKLNQDTLDELAVTRHQARG